MAEITALSAGSAHAQQFHIAWGDLPTWALFFGAFAAALIALRQLRIQQEDSVAGTRQLERKQADKIDFTWRRATDMLILQTGGFESEGRAVLIIENNSRRPIRDITCWIETSSPGGKIEPSMLGPVGEAPGDKFDFTLYNPRPGAGYPLMRPGTKYGFIFDFDIPQDDEIDSGPRRDRPMAQFTDDADLIWRIDDDLRLQKIDSLLNAASWNSLLGDSDP